MVLESNSLCLIDLDRTFFASLLLIFHAQNLFEKKKKEEEKGEPQASSPPNVK